MMAENSAELVTCWSKVERLIFSSQCDSGLWRKDLTNSLKTLKVFSVYYLSICGTLLPWRRSQSELWSQNASPESESERLKMIFIASWSCSLLSITVWFLISPPDDTKVKISHSDFNLYSHKIIKGASAVSLRASASHLFKCRFHRRANQLNANRGRQDKEDDEEEEEGEFNLPPRVSDALNDWQRRGNQTE